MLWCSPTNASYEQSDLDDAKPVIFTEVVWILWSACMFWNTNRNLFDNRQFISNSSGSVARICNVYQRLKELSPKETAERAYQLQNRKIMVNSNYFFVRVTVNGWIGEKMFPLDEILDLGKQFFMKFIDFRKFWFE